MKSKMVEFYKSLDEISVRNSKIDEKRQKLQNLVNDLRDDLGNVSLDENLRKANEALAKTFESIKNTAQSSIENWNAEFEKNLENEKFRSELENYFIVMIFGKVKAGKSYLGNFIVKNRLENQTVSFFEYDQAGKKDEIKELTEIDEKEFKTDFLECTSSIQGFKLSGLAWIDSPGLGSMTDENGELAKKYLSSADYVIYPSHSLDPFQMDENRELDEIFRANKEVTTIITKSDISGEDEINGEIVLISNNKSPEIRKGQEEDCKKRIKEQIGKEVGDIFSISTKMAKIGIENDDKEKFENSNISKLYENLTDIVKNKATKLKEQSPYLTLNSLIDEILEDRENSIAQIKESIDKFDEETRQTNEKFDTFKLNSMSEVGLIVDEVVSKYATNLSNRDLKKTLKKIDKEIETKFEEDMKEKIKKIIAKYEQAIENFENELSYDYEIKEKREKIVHSTKTRNKAVGSAVLGGAAMVALSFVPGVNVLTWTGAAIAGVTTAAAGYVGGKIGEATGEDEIEYVDMGDNSEEVILKFKEARTNLFAKQAEAIYENLQVQIFKPLEEKSSQIAGIINKFEKDMQAFRKELTC
ncbi:MULTISPECIES: hypothetical protein [unclassified Campylobacter]|uniref:hypothetical protein n=1 Tax=unclassified Campylobacter TaxID=2593542 RepID=UPI0022E9FC89|nr:MULTISPECIES: hypothetical protein [unclassified Campylobacter]MDA3042810.1 hypothetical protein [Campylobacter sp. JMF_09 ED2]MDA3044355.1 hypothetical protein [Campylobacter sp. JMF_07 ED4]MDA3063701.1 hypothetical protein [Campylobacter sp. JMF_11 EL3]MDA3071330.1 hypothetical protein [Campylobacter sp. VBCF_03 NA9]MDA3074790.1 hypothetical protein [Campylobacter sp. JMF_05 ED3]